MTPIKVTILKSPMSKSILKQTLLMVPSNPIPTHGMTKLTLP